MISEHWRNWKFQLLHLKMCQKESENKNLLQAENLRLKAKC